MKKSLILLAALAGALSAQALDVNNLKANENGKFWSGRAAEGYGISIGTEPKVLYNTLKVSSADGALVIDTREFFKQPNARKIVTRFYIKDNIAALKGKETSAKVQVQAEAGNGAVNLYLEGNRGTEKKHYFTAQPFAVSGRSDSFRKTSTALRSVLISTSPPFTAYSTPPSPQNNTAGI